MPYKNPKDKTKYMKSYMRLYLDRDIGDSTIRVKVNKINNASIKRIRSEIFVKLGGKCVRCGFSDDRALQIDHVNGNGAEDRRIKAQRKSYYNKVLSDNTGKYQLLCANCNWIKRHENKEFNMAGRSGYKKTIDKILSK